MYPDFKEFLRLSKYLNVIPVYTEINEDLDTPVSAFLKINKGRYAFLLESVEGQEKLARYSFMGIEPKFIIKTKRNHFYKFFPSVNKTESMWVNNPFREIKKALEGFLPAPLKGIPRFSGGLVGYIGYDTVRFFENLPDKTVDDLNLYDIVLMFVDTILVFDHISHSAKIISNVILPQKDKVSLKEKKALYNRAIKKIEKIKRYFNSPLKIKVYRNTKLKTSIHSNFSKEEFERIVLRAKKFIREGEIIQVVISQRFKVKTKKDPFEIYRILRGLNPSPYMFFLKLDKISLIGASPEMLVRYENGIVQTCPIAGTRHRGKNEEEDKKLEESLLKSKKEKAEHIMLVDLGRNDLGRVCKIGSLEVNEFMKVERYSHVMHLVSEIKGEIRKGLDAFDVLSACFPAGTVTGAPKVRAMQIIEELENIKRGPYAG
ncbi:MAG: chorismate-binding protein, partial [Candidatus Omnitrophica bacterium]|nr:chorismate-binding protein [Candidatus Omnitrophota bacterium]